MQDRPDAEQDVYRTGQMQDRSDVGQARCRTDQNNQMKDRTNAGQEGCKTGRM